MNAELRFISIKGNVETDFITAKSSDFIKIGFYPFVLVWGLCFGAVEQSKALGVNAFV